MPTEIILPRVDMDMTDATFGQWLVSEGDYINKGDVIFEIETTKANMEVEAPATGVIRYINAEEGVEYDVGTTLAWVYAADEDDIKPPDINEPRLSSESEGNNDDVLDKAASHYADGVMNSSEQCKSDLTTIEQGTRATPKARRLAREKGLSLKHVTGSGVDGCIYADDVKVFQGGAVTELNCVWLTPPDKAHTLVAIHGFSADASSWQPLVNSLIQLSDTVSVLAVELPAHGGSIDSEVVEFDAIVEAVAQSIAAEGLAQFHLVGHSLGGAVALSLASKMNSAISLSLLAPVGLGPGINQDFINGLVNAQNELTALPWLKELLFNTSLLDSSFVKAVVEPMKSSRVRASRRLLANHLFSGGTQLISLNKSLEQLKSIPVKVIWGLDDNIVDQSHCNSVPGWVAVHRFRHCGHLPQLEAKDEVAKLLHELVK